MFSGGYRSGTLFQNGLIVYRCFLESPQSVPLFNLRHKVPYGASAPEEFVVVPQDLQSGSPQTMRLLYVKDGISSPEDV